MATRWPTDVVISTISAADAVAMSNWHYEGASGIYDFNGQVPDSIDDYYSIRDPSLGGDLIGFFCVGYEARIPGLEEAEGTLDLGWGMNPSWAGRGHGTSFGAAVLAEAQRLHHDVSRIRAVVQSWNHRSIAVLRNLGFTSAGAHTCVQQGTQVQYDILTVSLEPAPTRS